MNRRLSRLAQLREDLNVALVLLVLGMALGAFSFISQPYTTTSHPSPQPASTNP